MQGVAPSEDLRGSILVQTCREAVDFLEGLSDPVRFFAYRRALRVRQ